MAYPHQPVLEEEVLAFLNPKPDGIYMDGTAGSAGHSIRIGEKISGRGLLISLDRDPDAVDLSKQRLAHLGARVNVMKGNYADLDKIMINLGIKALNGALLDLGLSSYQLDNSGRGFSFSRDERLDMRMDPEDETTAYDLVNHLEPKALENILWQYGEEKKAKLIAKFIVREREKGPVETSSQLAEIVKAAIHRPHFLKMKHPATRTFQALRIAVNKELQNIDTFLDKIPSLMAKNGRLVILSYHSLEDRLVKQTMVGWEKRCTCPPDLPQCACDKKPFFRRLTRKGIKAAAQEIEQNPRARSAILRAAERI